MGNAGDFVRKASRLENNTYSTWFTGTPLTRDEFGALLRDYDNFKDTQQTWIKNNAPISWMLRAGLETGNYNDYYNAVNSLKPTIEWVASQWTIASRSGRVSVDNDMYAELKDAADGPGITETELKAVLKKHTDQKTAEWKWGRTELNALLQAMRELPFRDIAAYNLALQYAKRGIDE
jgi:hypothetical protein